MSLMIGGLCRVIPLTVDAFGPDRDMVLEGTLQLFGEERAEGMGICFNPKNNSGDGAIYTHPTLFSKIKCRTNDCYDAKLQLRDGFIVLEVLPTGMVGDIVYPLMQAEPVTMSHITLEHVAELIARTQYVHDFSRPVCCRQGDCISEKKDYGDYRKMAIVVIGRNDVMIMCRECFEAMINANPEMEKHSLPIEHGKSVLDLRKKGPIPLALGWEIPPHTPVPVWNNPPVIPYHKAP